jgi:hypothetical protein
MSKFMTYDKWEETYQPINNTISKYPDDTLITFETYGDEYEAVKKAHDINPKTIWTEVDGDMGTYIVAGWHFVNRIHYYITENAWDDEWTEIPTWCYRECDNAEDNDGECPSDCEECDGESTINIPCDTVEDLKWIYGQDNEDIVG